jgi:hypothetical protein
VLPSIGNGNSIFNQNGSSHVSSSRSRPLATEYPAHRCLAAPSRDAGLKRSGSDDHESVLSFSESVVLSEQFARVKIRVAKKRGCLRMSSINRNQALGIIKITEGNPGQEGQTTRRLRFMALGWIISFLVCLQTADAVEMTAGQAPQNGSKPIQAVACPSQEFPIFLHRFSESAEIQRAFTSLPLKYGQVDQDLIGTGKPNFSTRMIRAFQKIPLFDKADGGRILPGPIKLKKNQLEIKIISDVPKGSSEKTAMLFAPDTGFHIYFKFKMIGTCWFLFEIDDKSV